MYGPDVLKSFVKVDVPTPNGKEIVFPPLPPPLFIILTTVIESTKPILEIVVESMVELEPELDEESEIISKILGVLADPETIGGFCGLSSLQYLFFGIGITIVPNVS